VGVGVGVGEGVGVGVGAGVGVGVGVRRLRAMHYMMLSFSKAYKHVPLSVLKLPRQQLWYACSTYPSACPSQRCE